MMSHGGFQNCDKVGYQGSSSFWFFSLDSGNDKNLCKEEGYWEQLSMPLNVDGHVA